MAGPVLDAARAVGGRQRRRGGAALGRGHPRGRRQDHLIARKDV
nr:hypothetical protein [Mycobacterium tuberculosis]